MTELLVGTKKGLFALHGDDGAFEIGARAFAGEPVEFAMRDPRNGRYFACVTSGLLRAEGLLHGRPRGRVGAGGGPRAPGGRRVQARAAVDDRSRRGGRAAVRRRCAGRPLREPRRRGDVGAERGVLEPAHAAGLVSRRRRHVHALDRDLARRPEPDRAGDLRRRRVALGRRRQDLAARQQGPPPSLPARGRARGHDRPLRSQHASRARRSPERLFMQFHGGVYRSDDAGESWISIAEGLPSDFGFPMVIDPEDRRQRVRHPARRRPRPDDARGPGSRLRDARRGRVVDGARRRAAAGGRVPDDPPPGARARRLGPGDEPLLRRDLGRRLRLA